MKEKYYLAADGGGSKLQVVLYDECYNVIRDSRVAGVNTLFKPISDVRRNVNGMMEELLSGLNGEIVGADISMLGAVDVVTDALKTHNCAVDINLIAEPLTGLFASFRTGGIVALSGTGSDVFFIKDGNVLTTVGGWGPLLGDEGSGYDIGLRALRAAIYSEDGRGEKTALQDMIMEKWGLSELWDIVTRLAGNPDARHVVASVAAICSEAAHSGDTVALGIYERAARDMFLAVKTAANRHLDEWDGSVTVMGGAWKGHPSMLESFTALIKSAYPAAVVYHPVFEPVIGCAVYRAVKSGKSVSDVREAMISGFSKFLYS